MAVKNYALDTNVILESEDALEIILNGKDGGDKNNVYIPWVVLDELDGLKKDQKISHKVARAVKMLNEFKDQVKVLSKTIDTAKSKNNDDKILDEIKLSNIDGLILITNDRILQFKAAKLGITAEEFKGSNPFIAESKKFTGFIQEGDLLVNNSFYWKEGKLHYNKQGEEKRLDYDNSVWTLTPKTPYQNALMELILDENIDILTVQSEAGFGKTTVALAGAIELLMNEKDDSNTRKYKKIFVFRPNVEIGQELGFLPGGIDEKMDPYFRPITDVLEMLNERKKIAKIWKKPKDANSKEQDLEINKRKFEMLPINYLRGMNISQSIVIIDEFQNMTRSEARTILSRLGTNVKCIITGDVSQIDNPHCNEDNNALNWVVTKFKDSKNYAHIVLTGKRSRGPIADLVREKSL